MTDNDFVIPRILSFEQLAIIYEKQLCYSDAIDVDKKAIELKLHDSTKSGFSGRLTRLENKQNKRKLRNQKVPKVPGR